MQDKTVFTMEEVELLIQLARQQTERDRLAVRIQETKRDLANLDYKYVRIEGDITDTNRRIKDAELTAS